MDEPAPASPGGEPDGVRSAGEDEATLAPLAVLPLGWGEAAREVWMGCDMVCAGVEWYARVSAWDAMGWWRP